MLLSASVRVGAAVVVMPPVDVYAADTLTHRMSEVEVDALRTSASVTASKPFQQMSRTELTQLGLTSLADAVKLFVGTEVRDYGGIGGLKTVSVRSLGAHHTAVSYDGLTLSNTQAGQIDIGRYQLDNVENVSIAFGAPDDQLQSARHYASAGVLSVRSEQPHFDFGHDYSVRLRLRGGSFGLLAPSVRYWQRLGHRTTLTADGAFMRANGRYPFTLINANTRSREKRYNSDVRSWQGEVNLYHTFADGGRLALKGSYYDSERGLPGAVILYNNPATDRLWERDGFAQAVYDKTFSPQWALRAAAKYTRTRDRYEVRSASYPNGIQIDSARQDEAYVTATALWMPIKPLSFALAQDVVMNRLHSNIYINTHLDVPNPRRITSLTALSGRLQFRRLQADACLLATYASEHVEAGNEPPVRRHLSPTIAVSYRLLRDQSFFVRAMLKHTFRMPSFNDTYYRRMGNPNLRPERAHEYNLGLTWNGRPAQWMRYLSFTADGYYNHVTDKIVAFPAAYVWRMANFGKVDIYGLDVTLGTEIPLTRRFSMGLTAAYTAQRAKDVDSGSPTYGCQLPYTPRHHATGTLLLHSPWADLGYSINGSSARYSSARNARTERLNGYAEHTLTASRSISLHSCRLDLSLSVHNLTDEHYEIIQYYPMPGRSVEASASLIF